MRARRPATFLDFLHARGDPIPGPGQSAGGGPPPSLPCKRLSGRLGLRENVVVGRRLRARVQHRIPALVAGAVSRDAVIVDGVSVEALAAPCTKE